MILRVLESSLSKLTLKMKLTTLFLVISVFGVQAESYSQKTKITLNLESVNLMTVFSEIESLSDFKFLGNENLIDNNHLVTIKVTKQRIDKILNTLFNNTNIIYKVIDKQIVLTRNRNVEIPTQILIKEDPLSVDIQQQITGTITDANGIPLAGASVLEKGTTNGVQTDFDGKFSINVSGNNAVLQVSYLGYTTQEITVAGQTNISVALQETASSLDEVVVIGYGSVKKSNLTAAVEMVDTDIIENRPVRTVAELLTGAVPGLNINITSGAVDASPNLNIRGFTGFNTSAQPLIMVDGVEANINNLNPNDVESISVLKDAAASAIYGSRAPYGVVLITTKNGKKGQALKITYSSTVQANSPFKLPHTENSPDFSRETNRRFLNSGQPAGFWSEETIARMQEYINGTGPNNYPIGERSGDPTDLRWEAHQFATSSTDYVGEAFKNTSYNQTHDLSFAGGSDKTSYYVAFGFNDREGVYATDLDNTQRYNISTKFDTNLKDWLNFGLNIRYTKTDVERPNYRGITSGIGADGSSEGRTRSSDDNFWNSVSYFPNVPIRNPDGDFHWLSAFPVLEGLAGSINQSNNELWITPSLTIKPLKGLTIKGQYSRNLTTGENLSTTKQVFVDRGGGLILTSGRTARYNDLTRSNSRREYSQIDVNAEYKIDFNDHDFTFLVGGQQEANQFKSIRVNRRDLYSVDFPVLGNAFGDNPNIGERFYEWSTRGYYGRMSYNYKGIYLLDVNARYDGSSRFRTEDRWDVFPSVSVGYNIASENFWPFKEVVNTFKITGSWGKLGNQRIDINGNNRTDDNVDIYTYSPVFGTGQTRAILNGGTQPRVISPALTRSDRTWEKPESIGFGLEAGLFNNKLTAEYRWYQRTTFDALGPAEQLPIVLGTPVPRANNAVAETRGWELALGWKDQINNVMGSPLHYSLRGTVADYIGYVVDYGPGNEAGVRGGTWTPGEVFGEIFGQRYQGIAQSTSDLTSWVANGNGFYHEGDSFYQDLDGDGIIGNGSGDTWFAQGDRVSLGYNYPRYRYSVFIDLEWKNFSFSVFLDGVGKEERFVNNTRAIGHSGGFWASATAYDLHNDLGYWNVDNRDAFFPRTYQGNKNVTRVNDRYLIDLAHLRIKNISLGYDLPKHILGADMSFNLNIENLGFIYNKSWLDLDPTLIRRGVSGYPTSQVVSFGTRLTF